MRQYLQEIGYTDSIIDVRSSRVRSLLGLINARGPEDNDEDANKINMDMDRTQLRRKANPSPAMPVVSEAESSVLATYDFLDSSRAHTTVNYDQMNMDTEEVEDEDEDNLLPIRQSPALDPETENVLAEFDFLSSKKSGRPDKDKDMATCWRSQALSKHMVDMGDLAAITVANESLDMNGSSYGSEDTQNALNNDNRKLWNPRYTLKGHFDCVRSLRFHAEEPLLVTCSEDETLKLWNLSRASPSNKGKQQPPQGSQTFDLEPIHTYRGHTSRVLSLCVINNTIYSGAENGEISLWKIPSNISTIDPYDAYNANLVAGTLKGHEDAVWSIIYLPSTGTGDIICSASADPNIKIWNSSKGCIKSITWSGNNRISCDFIIKIV